MKNSISVVKNTTRSVLLASIMVFGIVGVAYVQNSTAGSHDGSKSDQSRKSGQTTGESSGQGGTTSGHKDSQHKQGVPKKKGSVTESEQTGATGDTPSGRKSETSGQERGPSGY